ncbi:unnamed protein product [Trifolium pratense]|uniref:Uncharacterized protein n=1 Tax=Trifolium pratense TaxID=57577 RepID=A0ACB0KZ76_TRIPR|nr:unnamed protein product [Trifolium pratense]
MKLLGKILGLKHGLRSIMMHIGENRVVGLAACVIFRGPSGANLHHNYVLYENKQKKMDAWLLVTVSGISKHHFLHFKENTSHRLSEAKGKRHKTNKRQQKN